MSKHSMRHGSMGVWPRKRAVREYPRIRSWATSKDAKLLGFAGYKVGMTHVSYVDNDKNSLSKGHEIMSPVTIVECPPLHVFGARAYTKDPYGQFVVAQTLEQSPDKELARRISPNVVKKKDSKLPGVEAVDPSVVFRVTLICYTQPSVVGFGKKKPELFEIGVGGSIADQLKFAHSKIGSLVPVADVFAAGAVVDIHAVTKGFGNQGPVKRFGIALKPHKSEKGRRRPGAIGVWGPSIHTMYRVAFAGQTGYHTRTDYNKIILKIDDKPEAINAKGGFPRYGVVKNQYILIKGSVPGARKRLIRFNAAIRNKKPVLAAPSIEYVSLESKQR